MLKWRDPGLQISNRLLILLNLCWGNTFGKLPPQIGEIFRRLVQIYER